MPKLTPFDRFKVRYVKAGGSPYESDAWILRQMGTGRSPLDVAQISRTIGPSDFDDFVARVLMYHRNCGTPTSCTWPISPKACST